MLLADHAHMPPNKPAKRTEVPAMRIPLKQDILTQAIGSFPPASKISNRVRKENIGGGEGEESKGWMDGKMIKPFVVNF